VDLGVGTVLLLALAQGPGFGLGLISRVAAMSRRRVSLNRGSVSLALRKLEEEGLVRGWVRSSGAAGRPRLYYELTPKGIARLEETRETLAGLLNMRAPEVGEAERRRMAERVERSGELSELALRIRDAAVEAGLG